MITNNQDQELFNELLSKLSGHDIGLLKQLMIRFAGQPFSDESWTGVRIPGRSGAELHLSFLSLRKAGWVRAVKKVWGERLYYIPVERLFFLQSYFFNPEPVPVEVDQIHITTEARPGIALDLLHVLAYVAEQGLPLTAKGTIHKRSLLKLLEIPHLQQSDLQRLSLKYAHSEAYTVEAAVIVDLLLCLGLLSQDSQGMTIQEERLRSWLSLSEEEMNRILFHTVLERYSHTESGMQHFRYLICQSVFQTAGWFDITFLLDWMAAEGLLSARSEADDMDGDASAWLHALAGFGWGDVGTCGSGRLCFKWKISAAAMFTAPFSMVHGDRHEGVFYVQPDFDIIVPPEVSYWLRWKLLSFTELRQSGLMSIYRLTKSSAARAVEQGLDVRAIAECLSMHGKEGVPEHVAAAIEQWGKEIGRTRFMEATLLVCTTEQEGSEIASHPQLAGKLQRIGPEHFIVKAGQLSQVRKALETMGLPPMKMIFGTEKEQTVYPIFSDQPTVPESPDFIRSMDVHEGQGLVYSGRNVHYFQEDLEIPAPDSLFPGLNDIPVMWLKDFRLYHTSTAQDMIKLALDWKTKVLIAKEGKHAEFTPNQIASNPWRAKGELCFPEDGSCEVWELATGDFQEMRLIVPSTQL